MLLNITDSNIFYILELCLVISYLTLLCISSCLTIMNAVSPGYTLIDWWLWPKDASHHQSSLDSSTALWIISLLVGRTIIIAICDRRFDAEDLWGLLCHRLIRGLIVLREVNIRQVLSKSSRSQVGRALRHRRAECIVLMGAIVDHTVWGWSLMQVDCTLVFWRRLLCFLFLMVY
jgi:hypothetical protein